MAILYFTPSMCILGHPLQSRNHGRCSQSVLGYGVTRERVYTFVEPGWKHRSSWTFNARYLGLRLLVTHANLRGLELGYMRPWPGHANA